MILTMINFGGFSIKKQPLMNTVLPNGYGKTSTIQAYIWVLTGKCINGFDQVYRGRFPHEPERLVTQVTLKGFAGTSRLSRRVYPDGKTHIILDGEPLTQVELAARFRASGVDIYLAAAMADVTVLTDDSLAADDLRRLLGTLDVVPSDAVKSIGKELDALRGRLVLAEKAAVTNLVERPHTVLPLSESERAYLETYDTYLAIANAPITDVCRCCGQEIPQIRLAEARRKRDEAIDEIKKRSDEVDRLQERHNVYSREAEERAAARLSISAAVKAREDAKRIKQEIEDKQRELSDTFNGFLELPEGVEVVTEVKLKNGSTKDTCQLRYKGLPLKSLNYALRVEILVRIMHARREALGLTEVLPIVLDNAESVQGLRDIPNLIRFEVGEREFEKDRRDEYDEPETRYDEHGDELI